MEGDAARLRDQSDPTLAAIVESSDDAIISKTLDGVVRTWNRGAEHIFGYSPEEMIGDSILKLIPPDRHHEEPEILRRISAGERIDHYETQRLTKDGRLIDVSVTISPIRDKSGRIVGASKIARDVTAQKHAERELRAAMEKAESAARARDLFLNLLSHELRTPLTPVLAALSFLQERHDLSDELRQELSMIRLNVETEARLVDDLLDVMRINRGALQVDRQVIDAHRTLHNAVEMLKEDFDARNVHVLVELQASKHHVMADPARVQQIFMNLLSNAVKFTPAGGSLHIGSRNIDERLRLEFSDTGIGIDQELLPRLFKPFEQGNYLPDAGMAGLGLGLAITQSLVLLHGGTVAASSPGRGKGSTFTIELPTTAAAKKPARPSYGGKLPSRILLVEDHDDTRRVMERLLKSFGCNVTAARSVAEAKAKGKSDEFDVVISDIGLPDGTGMEVMRSLREKTNIKGIALSGYGQDEDLRRSAEAGFDAHLVKPINFQTLQQTLEKLCAPTTD